MEGISDDACVELVRPVIAQLRASGRGEEAIRNILRKAMHQDRDDWWLIPEILRSVFVYLDYYTDLRPVGQVNKVWAKETGRVPRLGDLPLVYNLEHPLHASFSEVLYRFQQHAESATPETPQNFIDLIKSLTEKHEVEEVRLILFYSAFRTFLGEGRKGKTKVHPRAEEIAHDEELKAALNLTPKHQRILWVALDRNRLTEYNGGEPVAVIDNMKRGFVEDSTWILCTAMAVAVALPDSMLAVFAYDIDSLKDHYIPGDRTNNAVVQGGCYKFDCVTQVDMAGNLNEFARSQPIMSAGSCYILWGLEFGLLQLQMLLFHDQQTTSDTMVNWVVSPDLRQRWYATQHGKSDYRHVTDQLTERSQAHFFHMGAKIGLTPRQARRMFAFTLGHFFDDRKGSCKILSEGDGVNKGKYESRASAKEVEKAVEAIVQRYLNQDRPMLNIGFS